MDPETQGAETLQERSVQAIQDFTRANAAELLSELENDAIRVTEELAEARAQVTPYEQAYNEVVGKVRTIAQACHRGRSAPPTTRMGNVVVEPDWDPETTQAWALPTDGVPLPDQAAVAGVQAKYGAPELVAVGTRDNSA